MIDRDSKEYLEARKITHHWMGYSEFVHLDVTERVMEALKKAREESWQAGKKAYSRLTRRKIT